MIPDLDESLKDLILAHLQLPPGEVEVSFDPPTSEWSAPITRPTINLFMYDLRENVKLRETAWTQAPDPKQPTRVKFQRAPLRIDLSYMITCWTSASEDQHRLLWAVLECLLRNSTLPEALLRSELKSLTRGVRLEVSQTEGVLSNLSDYWTALGNPIRPSINVVATVDLDLHQLREAPMVGSRVHLLQQGAARRTDGRLLGLSEIGGLVRRAGVAVQGAAVRLLGTKGDGAPQQIGPSVTTDHAGRFRMRQAPDGGFTLVVESSPAPPWQRQVSLGQGGDTLPLIIDLPTIPAGVPDPQSGPTSSAPDHTSPSP